MTGKGQRGEEEEEGERESLKSQLRARYQAASRLMKNLFSFMGFSRRPPRSST